MLEKRTPIKRKRLVPGFKLSFPLKFKSSVFVAFLIGLSAGCAFYPLLQPSSQATSLSGHSQIEAHFSPGGQCTEKIIEAINTAEASIDVMAYAFTSSPIAHALVRAFERGVAVKILIDRSQLKAKHSQLHFLLQHKIPIFIDPAKGIAHNKVMIFDAASVLTGSFNFSHAAETKNAENLLLIRDPSLAQIYKKNWEQRVKWARKL